jgi:hypothetical protein
MSANLAPGLTAYTAKDGLACAAGKLEDAGGGAPPAPQPAPVQATSTADATLPMLVHI